MALAINTSSKERTNSTEPAAEESNIRDLVENCIQNDEVTPLLRLLLEAQAIPDTPSAIQGNATCMADTCLLARFHYMILDVTVPA